MVYWSGFMTVIESVVEFYDTNLKSELLRFGTIC